MTRSKRRKKRLTDAEIREKIGNILGQHQKASYLIATLLLSFFLALTVSMSMSVPPTLTRPGVLWGKALGIAGVLWTLVAALGWKRLSPQKLKRLPKEEQRRHYRSETMWFYFWKGGYLVQVSIAMLLMGVGLLMRVLRPAVWVSVLAGAGYLLAFVVSFCQRKRILRVIVEGWSADTRWGRLMLRLAAIGPVAGASIGVGLTRAVVRLRIVPENVLFVFGGLVGILVAYAIVPQIIHDFSVAWIHLQIRRAEEKR